MIKRSWFVVGVALATVLGVSPAAYATSIELVPVSVDGSGAKISVMPNAVDDGDCRMTAATIRIDPPAADGSTLVTWDGTAYTRHTKHADIWNLYLNLEQSDGTFVLSLPALHSDKMTRINTDYSWTRYVRVQMTRTEFDRIGQLEWIGTC